MKSLINAMKSPVKEKSEPKTVTAKPPKPTGDSLADSLAKSIDKHIEGELKPRYRKSKGFSPSDASNCARYWYYKFNGIEIPVSHDARVQRIFDTGNSVHDRIVRYFNDMGILIAVEHPVPQRPDSPPISGFIDAIINWDGDVVVEMKSISQEGFQYRKIYKKPKDDHMQQIQLYLHYTNIRRGIVIYENKNDQRLLCIDVEYNEPYVRKILKRYDKILEVIKQGVLPERPYKKTSKNCEYCRLKTVCWNDDSQ